MKKLRLSPDLALPIDVAGETIAILAKRGAGKTNTSTVLVEELVRSGVQTVIVDPVSAWWGIRSSAAGEKGAGLAVPILGGQHGDVPLEETAGKLIADVAVDTGESLLLDLSDLPTKAAMERFVWHFAERLYRRKARSGSLLHLVLEEADMFAPQSPRGGWGGDGGKMTAAIEAIVRRGRSRGLGVTLITQRSAVLNKDVLTQADVLIAMRTTGPQDVKAIKGWVAERGDEHGQTVIESLPGLKTGEGWIWNPERELLERVMFRKRRTYDSSETPKAGQKRAAPGDAAPIDLGALGEQIQATAEKAKAEDPAELRKQLRELEQQAGKAGAEYLNDLKRAQRRIAELEEESRVRQPETVEVPVLSDHDRTVLQNTVNDLIAHGAQLLEFKEYLDEAMQPISAGLARAGRQEALPPRPPARPRSGDSSNGRASADPAGDAGSKPAPRSTAAVSSDPAAGGGAQLKKGERRMLETLGRHFPSWLTRDQLSTLAQVTKGGTFSSYLSRLRTEGLIQEDGTSEVAISEAGLEEIGGPPGPPLSTGEIVDGYMRVLKEGERRMLEILVATSPGWMSRDELSERAAVTKGGTFSSYLSRLRTNGLVEENGRELRASETLFMGAS